MIQVTHRRISSVSLRFVENKQNTTHHLFHFDILLPSTLEAVPVEAHPGEPGRPPQSSLAICIQPPVADALLLPLDSSDTSPCLEALRCPPTHDVLVTSSTASPLPCVVDSSGASRCPQTSGIPVPPTLPVVSWRQSTLTTKHNERTSHVSCQT